jgi:hypothetical protein
MPKIKPGRQNIGRKIQILAVGLKRILEKTTALTAPEAPRLL